MSEAKRPTAIAAGTLVVLSTGSYSDFYVEGVYRALKDINPGELRAHRIDEYGLTKFLAWLVREGYLEHIPSRELWIDGGDVEIYGGDPPDA